MLGQAQINENLTKNLASNNKILESIKSNLEGLTSSFKNQLSLNKMFETQLTQIATTIPAYDFEKILGQFKICKWTFLDRSCVRASSNKWKLDKETYL